MSDLDGIAFTRGPGLLGSLLVGVSFAKGLALSLDVPMMEINHLQGHICSHFIDLPDRDLPHPRFPFLCLLVSGGHSQIVLVKDYLRHGDRRHDDRRRGRRRHSTSAPRSWAFPTPAAR